MTHFLNQYTTTPFTPSHYERTEDGFLRVTARVLAERVMPYLATELEKLPEGYAEPVVNMVVTRETMGTGESLRTLEGSQVVAPDHVWVTPDNAAVSKGNTAGSARLDGPYLVIDLLVTDPETIRAIESKEIGEISAGYNAETIFEQGEFDGQPYDAKQCQLRFNHIAIIAPGTGRAGNDVRIINAKNRHGSAIPSKSLSGYYVEFDDEPESGTKGYWIIRDSNMQLVAVDGEATYRSQSSVESALKKVAEGKAKIHNTKPQETNKTEVPPMSVRIKLANTGKFINVDEEAASALEAEQSATEAKGKESDAASGKKLEELMAQVEELNSQIAELTSVSEEAKGELSVYKEKLDELLSDEAAEAQTAAMVAESDEADEIIENAVCDMEEKEGEKIKNSFQRIGNTKIHSLRGTALQSAVLGAVGMKVENMAPAEIKGAFKARYHMAVANKGRTGAKVVAGAKIFNQNTAKGDHIQNSGAMVNAMWGKKAQ